MLQFKLPDPTWHARLSFIKSAIRIAAGISLMFGLYVICGFLLIMAEIGGIIEELV